MKVLNHHIYEYKKGLRNLILHTTKRSNQTIIEHRLQEECISYLVKKINDTKINVFFGHHLCIQVLQSFDTFSLDKLSTEQDFILGIMLGYDRLQQCKRYIQKIDNREKVEELIG